MIRKISNKSSKYLVYLAILLVALSIYWLFFVKQYVEDLKQQLDEVNHQIYQEKDSIHVFRAEFSYLRSPDRLQALATKYLKLEPIQPKQMVADLSLDNGEVLDQDLRFAKNRKKFNRRMKLAKWRYKKGPAEKYITYASTN